MITTIYPSDHAGTAQVQALLEKEGLRMDANIDYTCGVLDDAHQVIATGSCYANTLRCFAVDDAHQGKGLLNKVLTHLMNVQQERGNSSVFLYTKGASAPFFCSLGFHEIARVSDTIVFLENRSWGFPEYLRNRSRSNTQDGGSDYTECKPVHVWPSVSRGAGCSGERSPASLCGQ